jgi:import inner membrane translocase subunit TIM9
MYNTLTERCFATCVSSFRSKTLDKGETTCIANCAERYIKMTQRVGLRFAEDQALRQKRAADAAGGA